MTFYWWSHWFWITTNLQVIAALLILLPNAINYVHTYPSQQEQQQHEISVTYTRSAHVVAAETVGVGSVEAMRVGGHEFGGSPEMKNTQKLQQITKLYQTTASLAWATTNSPPAESSTTFTNKAKNVMDLTIKPSELTRTTATTTTTTTVGSIYAGMHRNSKELQQEYKRSAEFDKSNHNNNNNNSNDNADAAAAADDDDVDVDNKNVAGNDSDASAAAAAAAADTVADSVAAGSQTVAVAHMLNNYTNYSRKASTKTNATKTTTATTTAYAPASNMSQRTTSTSTSTTPLAAIAKATTTAAAGAGWVGVAVAVPTTPSASAIGATPSTPQINTAAEFEEHEPDEQQQQQQEQQQQQRAPFTLENVNAEDELRRAEVEHRARKSKGLSAEYKHINRYINLSSDTKSLLTRSASTAPNDFETDDGNISSEALSIQRTYFLDAGAISAICFTVFGICCTVGTIGIVLYRRRYLNKPQALSEPDSSVYIDDSTMRDNSDEMYSLDNDSFLNSLEAMTIQNYWTDTVKHTKL